MNTDAAPTHCPPLWLLHPTAGRFCLTRPLWSTGRAPVALLQRCRRAEDDGGAVRCCTISSGLATLSEVAA